MLPYGRQSVEEDDIDAVISALRSDFLTTGPLVGKFEQALAAFAGESHAVVFCNGTAALHAAMNAIGVGPGDEVIVPAMTFAATANCVVYQGGTPVFADVTPGDLLIDPVSVKAKVTPRTKAIIAMDYAGQPCPYDELRSIADSHNIRLVADACHSLGASYSGRPVGSLADVTTFSFHPVKPLTTGEGGALTTRDPEVAERASRFRNHGITHDHQQRLLQDTWFYEIRDIGYNFRLTDFQCALGMSQLKKVLSRNRRRRDIADFYSAAFADLPGITSLIRSGEREHAYHLYVVRLDPDLYPRRNIFTYMRRAGIGVNVHYIPVHLHPFYRSKFGTKPGTCPIAEQAYEEILSLPIYPAMTDEDATRVVHSLREACASTVSVPRN